MASRVVIHSVIRSPDDRFEKGFSPLNQSVFSFSIVKLSCSLSKQYKSCSSKNIFDQLLLLRFDTF